MPENRPSVLVFAPTWSGGEYALGRWADAYHAMTYPHRDVLMVDNSDGPPDGNLHYVHKIRAKGIDAIWQQVRFKFLWDTLELSWQLAIDHAEKGGHDFILSLEHDIIAPPDTIEIMLAASLADTPTDKPAIVSHRYHPRGQVGPDYWFDTLGCTLIPTAPLVKYRNRLTAIFECDVFMVCQNEGHKRVRLKDKLDLVHLPHPDDHHKIVFGAEAAATTYAKRVKEQMKDREPETREEQMVEAAHQLYGLGKVRQAEADIPMGTEAVCERTPDDYPSGGAVDPEWHGQRDIVDRAEAVRPFQNLTLEEKVRSSQEEHLRLNIGSGLSQISGFKSVDFDPGCNPDILAPADELPLPDDCVEDIYASHVLEHLPYESPVLGEWLRVLKPGGMLTVAVPDVIQIYYLWKHGGVWGEQHIPITEKYLNATVFGANLIAEDVPEMERLWGGPGHRHQQIFLFVDQLINRLIEAGFVEVHEVTRCFLRSSSLGEMMVQARKAYPDDVRFPDEREAKNIYPPKDFGISTTSEQPPAPTT